MEDFIYMTDGKRCPKIHNSEECIAQAEKDGFRKATEQEVKAYLESKGKKTNNRENSEVDKKNVTPITEEKPKTTAKQTKKQSK